MWEIFIFINLTNRIDNEPIIDEIQRNVNFHGMAFFPVNCFRWFFLYLQSVFLHLFREHSENFRSSSYKFLYRKHLIKTFSMLILYLYYKESAFQHFQSCFQSLELSYNTASTDFVLFTTFLHKSQLQFHRKSGWGLWMFHIKAISYKSLDL